MTVLLRNVELQAKVDLWVQETGRPADELGEDAVSGYLDESALARNTLDGRYDEIKHGQVELIDGEEAFAELKEIIHSYRKRMA